MSANGRQTYTVKHVAKLTCVSVRTLRFYDEIGLLKPAFYGENGYRYYEKEQLLLLQQILFYRELGFELSMIQNIIVSPEFDKIAALQAHRDHLSKVADKTNTLICTIDKTLAHLKGAVPMKDNEMYLGFDEAVKLWGEPARSHVAECKRRTKNWKKDDYETVRREFDEVHRAITVAITRGLSPGEPEVQDLVKRHYAIVSRFWTPNRESYAGLGRFYCEHPDFRKLYDDYHPRFAGYLAEAMKLFADDELNA